MAQIVANTTFGYKGEVYTHGVTYDTADNKVAQANTALPHYFYATGRTKTAHTGEQNELDENEDGIAACLRQRREAVDASGSGQEQDRKSADHGLAHERKGDERIFAR